MLKRLMLSVQRPWQVEVPQNQLVDHAIWEMHSDVQAVHIWECLHSSPAQKINQI